MSEEKMQELQNRVVESIQDYFGSYAFVNGGVTKFSLKP